MSIASRPRALAAPSGRSAPLSTRGGCRRGVLVVVAPRIDILHCHCWPRRGRRGERRLRGVSHRLDGGGAGGVDCGEPTSGPAALTAQRGGSKAPVRRLLCGGSKAPVRRLLYAGRAAACRDEAVASQLCRPMAAAAATLRRRLQGRPLPERPHLKRLGGCGSAQPARRRGPRVERAVLAAAEDARRVRVGGAARGGAEVSLEHTQPAAARQLVLDEPLARGEVQPRRLQAGTGARAW